MARITVEDCLQVVDNRFELVLMATRRARQLAKGAEAVIDPENDKPSVSALREIADRRIDIATIDEIDRIERELSAEEDRTDVPHYVITGDKPSSVAT